MRPRTAAFLTVLVSIATHRALLLVALAVPLSFGRGIYATICLGGGAIYLLLLQWFGRSDILIFICVALIFSVRVFAVKRKWYLPAIREVT